MTHRASFGVSRLTRLRTSASRPWAQTVPKDLDAERQRQATVESAHLIDAKMPNVIGWRGKDAHSAKLDLLRWAVGEAPRDGLALEFGVASGETPRVIASIRHVHGFDSFEGLPEDWYGEYRKGVFAQPLPEVDGAELHVGWFEESLPQFLHTHQEPFAFVHMDADLYSSTKTILTLASERLIPGTVITFDEYFNYPGWQQHEHKALVEYLDDSGRAAEYIAYNTLHEQVVIRLR